MPDRVFIGDAKLRISKPGKDVSSTDIRDFVFREDMDVFKPYYTGSYFFGGAGSHTFDIPQLSEVPVIVMKSSDNRAMGTCYYGKLNAARNKFTVVNKPWPDGSGSDARTITFYIFQTASA